MLTNIKVTVFIGHSDDIVSLKQWGMYIVLVHYYTETPEPITAQLSMWSELISPRETTVVLFLYVLVWLFQQLNLQDGFISLF